MALLRSLSRLVLHPSLSSGQLSAGIASGLRSACVASQGAQQQQCSSLLAFLQNSFQIRTLATRSSSEQGLRQLVSGASQSAAEAAQLCSSRGFASKLTPRFTGCKLKPYSSYKERFKMTGTGKIRYMRPGHVHKRFNKSRRQNAELGKTQVLYETYAKTMRKLGFVMRSF